jgi:hypothetical protein
MHLFIVQGHVDFEGAAVLGTGDVVGLSSAGGRRVTSAGSGAEILIWETTKDLEV